MLTRPDRYTAGASRSSGDILDPRLHKHPLVGLLQGGDELDLEDVAFDRATGTLTVAVPAIPGVACKIRFISTKKGCAARPRALL